MVATTPKNSIPYPQQGDSPNEATAMANMVGQVDRRMVPRFSSTTDRTTRVPSPSDGMLGWLTTASEHQIYRAGAWNHMAFSRTLYKAATTSRTTSPSLLADPDLTMSVLAGKIYIVDFRGNIQGDTGVDFNVALSLPPNSNGNAFSLGPPVALASTTNASVYCMSGATFTGVAVSPSWTFGTVPSPNSVGTFVRWVIGTNNAGTLALTWSQNVSSALATSLLLGSSLTVTMVA